MSTDLNYAEVVKPLTMESGFFYVTEFSATGGVSYNKVGKSSKQIHEDQSLTAQYTTRKEVDHIGLATWSRKIINLAYGVMERHCSVTPMGYWVSVASQPAMLSELAEVRKEADSFNRAAKDLKSKRRCAIVVYEMRAGGESEEQIAIRLAQTIRERLESLREDLRAGDLNAWSTSWKRAKNLPRLATGIQAESIVMGLEAAKIARSELRKAISEGKDPGKAGEELNLDTLDSAIFLFTDSVNGTLARVEDPEA